MRRRTARAWWPVLYLVCLHGVHACSPGGCRKLTSAHEEIKSGVKPFAGGLRTELPRQRNVACIVHGTRCCTASRSTAASQARAPQRCATFSSTTWMSALCASPCSGWREQRALRVAQEHVCAAACRSALRCVRGCAGPMREAGSPLRVHRGRSYCVADLSACARALHQ